MRSIRLCPIFLNNISDFDKHFNGSAGEIVLMSLLWFLGTIVPVMVGSSLVVFIAVSFISSTVEFLLYNQ